MKENFMARALNKNKKPETNNKNRACNYFLGSFGSPCGFWRLACGEGARPRWVAKQPQALERFRNHASAAHWNGGKPPRHTAVATKPHARHPLQALAQLPTPSPD
ncbi:hypothetical protein F7R14_21295 [Pseudomonas lini]|uniref:Uncharacterized protein n=1 Tax=Pseudomonas lini TaxID=163011 RepID=A0A7V7P1Z1_9PSED|nr:hypothetical protein F7R14_21295 [Pseudomonas lini]MDT9676816.1 hypothetical protein [Pseudomonas sp. JV414]